MLKIKSKICDFLFKKGTEDNSKTKKEMFFWNGSIISHVGLKRENNEDNFLFNQIYNKDSVLEVSQTLFGEDIWLCAGVFDGMGGGENGELASRLAVEEVKTAFCKITQDSTETEVDNVMKQAFLNANRRIVEEQKLYAMYGTTGTVLCTNGKKIKIYHLGDSRAYLFRDENLYQLTKDQTLANLKISAGFYEADDPLVEKEKHQLTEYIGCDKTMQYLYPLESEWLNLQSKDKLLLCSDGLYDMCTDLEICEIIKNYQEPELAVKELLHIALEHGGVDNVTCLILQIRK